MQRYFLTFHVLIHCKFHMIQYIVIITTIVIGCGLFVINSRNLQKIDHQYADNIKNVNVSSSPKKSPNMSLNKSPNEPPNEPPNRRKKE
uniref:Female-specific orf protein n=1 Tax=Strongyloides venezuelensis TaxID=75913 RepID=A0A0K0FFQ1_STRVS